MRALLLLLTVLYAGPAIGTETDESAFDRIWSTADLYSGSEESFFQSLQFSGRLQLDFAYVDSGEIDHGEFNVRRFRLGFKTVFLRELTLHLEGDFDVQDADPFYSQLTDAYLAWTPNDRVTATLGKHSAGFTLDGMTSSKRLLTIDRSNLANNIWFTDEYIPGLSVKGDLGGLTYFAGVFSSGDHTPEFGDFTGGQFVLLTLGHDFAGGGSAERALLRLNLVDNEPDPDNGFTRPLERIGSLNFSYTRGRWSFGADVSAATGYGQQSDLRGVMIMPSYDLSERLQVVTRYTFVESDEVNGVRFSRYERSIEEGEGDRYDEIYLGLNYFFYGHELKLQNGVQWVEMEDRADDGGEFSGWAWTTALRISW